MDFLTPLASLVALVVVAPLAAHALLERRARRVSRRLGLSPPAIRSRLGVPVAIVAVAAFLGIAAAQPVVSGSTTRLGRADAEVFLVFDTSRSMLARLGPGAPTRLDRAKELALTFRSSLSDIPVGIASLNDRLLPNLFPTLDSQVFVSTLRDAIGIERPPPGGTGTLATDFAPLGDAGTNDYFTPGVSKRLLIVFSDGESRQFDDIQLAQSFRKGGVRVIFVHVWDAREQIFLTPDNADPGYRPDAESIRSADRVAAAGNGSVLGEDARSLVTDAKGLLGSGPATRLRDQRTQVSLAPFVALAALLPLSFVFLRRNL